MEKLTAYEKILCVCGLDLLRERIISSINFYEKCLIGENNADSILILKSMIDYFKEELCDVEKVIEKLRAKLC